MTTRDRLDDKDASGIEMAARALRGAMPGERVQAICLAYCDELYARLPGS